MQWPITGSIRIRIRCSSSEIQKELDRRGTAAVPLSSWRQLPCDPMDAETLRLIEIQVHFVVKARATTTTVTKKKKKETEKSHVCSVFMVLFACLFLFLFPFSFPQLFPCPFLLHCPFVQKLKSIFAIYFRLYVQPQLAGPVHDS